MDVTCREKENGLVESKMHSTLLSEERKQRPTFTVCSLAKRQKFLTPSKVVDLQDAWTQVTDGKGSLFATRGSRQKKKRRSSGMQNVLRAWRSSFFGMKPLVAQSWAARWRCDAPQASGSSDGPSAQLLRGLAQLRRSCCQIALAHVVCGRGRCGGWGSSLLAALMSPSRLLGH